MVGLGRQQIQILFGTRWCQSGLPARCVSAPVSFGLPSLLPSLLGSFVFGGGGSVGACAVLPGACFGGSLRFAFALGSFGIGVSALVASVLVFVLSAFLDCSCALLSFAAFAFASTIFWSNCVAFCCCRFSRSDAGFASLRLPSSLLSVLVCCLLLFDRLFCWALEIGSVSPPCSFFCCCCCFDRTCLARRFCLMVPGAFAFHTAAIWESTFALTLFPRS